MRRRSRMGVSMALGVLAVSSTTMFLSLAVTMWLAPLTTAMTAFPVVKPNGAWVNRNGQESFTLFVGVKNEGSSPAVIENILLNKVPFREISGETEVTVVSDGVEHLLNPDDPQTYLTLRPGTKGQIRIAVPDDVFSVGQIVSLEIKTSAGIEYLATVNLL